MTINSEVKRDIESLYAQSTDEYLRHIQEKAGSKRIFTQAELENFDISQILEVAKKSNKKKSSTEVGSVSDIDFKEALDSIEDGLDIQGPNYAGLADMLIVEIGEYLLTQASKNKQNSLKQENAKKFINVAHRVFGTLLKGDFGTYYQWRQIALFIIALKKCGSSVGEAKIATALWVGMSVDKADKCYGVIKKIRRDSMVSENMRSFIIRYEPELSAFIQECREKRTFSEEWDKPLEAYERLLIHLNARKREREVIGVEDADLRRLPFLS